jgi:hypothetical protein
MLTTTDHTLQKKEKRELGVLTPMGWTYAIYGCALAACALTHQRLSGYELSGLDAIVPALLALSGFGVTRRWRWARWACYFFSVLLLAAVPIGTLLGGLMIYQLTRLRDQFKRRSKGLEQHA